MPDLVSWHQVGAVHSPHYADLPKRDTLALLASAIK
jgi:hypothetical protein